MVESTIIEARLTLVNDDAGTSAKSATGENASSETQDDAAAPRDQALALSSRCPSAPVTPRMPLPLRLPQRKRYCRSENPPLRVAHQSTTSLAK
jgi:hypothetical protein